MVNDNKKISVIGLGKLGLPFALVFASNGFSVVGYDINSGLINNLRLKNVFIKEKKIQNLLENNYSNIEFTSDAKKVVEDTNISFIIVPTPSKNDGSFSTVYIEEVINKMSFYLKKKQKKHIFVITSTISPGTIEKIIKPLLEIRTHKKIGKQIGICYSPELIALGSVVENLIHPDFIFIGESDVQSGNTVEIMRKKVCVNKPNIIHTTWVNAELIKLLLNSYITTKISFANMIARICEKTPEANADVISSALGLDSRIGPKYIKGGLAYGGPCFPRDNRALSRYVKDIKSVPSIPVTVDYFNKIQHSELKKIIKKYSSTKEIVGILGLSYKPDTDVIDESAAIFLIKELIKAKTKVVVFDPKAMDNTKKILGKKIFFAKSAKECIKKSNIIVVATPWNEFKNLKIIDFKKPDKILTVIDCWRILNYKEEPYIIYRALGTFLG